MTKYWYDTAKATHPLSSKDLNVYGEHGYLLVSQTYDTYTNEHVYTFVKEIEENKLLTEEDYGNNII